MLNLLLVLDKTRQEEGHSVCARAQELARRPAAFLPSGRTPPGPWRFRNQQPAHLTLQHFPVSLTTEVRSQPKVPPSLRPQPNPQTQGQGKDAGREPGQSQDTGSKGTPPVGGAQLEELLSVAG